MADKSVALKYERDVNEAPFVVAKGAGNISEMIVNLARESKVPIYKNDKLVESLYRLRENEEIPGELYQVVAELFGFIHSLKYGN